MSESLIKLKSCCGQLIASDKITERKKQIDVFKKELGRPAVCRQLDENSKKGRGMIWEHCFEAVREFMVKEVAHVRSRLASGKANQDHRKLLATTNIFKWFVQKANNTGEHLKLAKLVDHVILLIKDETSVLCYGTECCMVVSREVLGSWYYSCRLITKNWQDFLKYFCLILRDPPPGISLDLSTQLVHQLFAGAVQHSNIKKGIFFNFFKQIIEKCRSSEFSSTMVNTILGAMNTFCLYAAGDCREQVCRLGEETILTLLHIWKAQHSTTKAALVEFMYLQMRVHHPKGALTEAEGARAVNMVQWKSLVHKIYEVLYLEWTQASNKLKLKGLGAKEIKFSSSLVELAADVCHQVFTGSQELLVPDGFEPSSQSNTPKRKNVAGTTPVKRRKLESGWKMLRDHMTQAGQSPSIIPWLQLAEALIRRYPEALPTDQIAEFLAIFIQLQSECKRGEIHSQILLCLEALALCQATQTPQSTPGHHHPTGSQWTKVWAGTIRTIGLRTTEREVFSLLTTLLVRKLVCPGQEVWKLFTSSIIHPTQYSVSFLSTLLRNTFLPEKHSNELRPNCESDYPLREDLLEWLLSSMEASDITENMKPVTNTGKNIPSTLFSTVLCSLICKSPKAVLAHDYSSVLPLDDISPLSQVENLYLCSSFDDGDVNDKGIPEDSPSSRELTPTILPDMLQHLMKKLTEACRSHQQLDFSEVSSIQSAIQFSSVILKVLTVLIARDISSLEDPPVAQIMRSLRSLLNLITESIKTSLSNLDEANKDDLLQSFHPPVKNLVETFTWPSSDGSILSKKERRTFCHVIRRSISTELLDLLMMFVINKGIKKRGQSSAFTSSRHGDVIRDDFDDEFDTSASMRSTTDAEEDEFVVHQSSMSMNQDGDGEYASKHTTLSVTDQFCLTSCYVLAHCCSSLCNEYSSPGGNHGIDQHELLKKLLQSFQEEKWEPKPPTASLQMVFGTASIILKSDNRIEDDLLLLILKNLRSIASTYRRDQDTCCKILETIKLVVPRLKAEEGRMPMDMMAARETALHLLRAFWTLQKEGHYTRRVRLGFMETLYALLAVDPESRWALLQSTEKGQGDADKGVKIRDILASQLTDSSHSVRVHMAKSMKSFFNSSLDGMPSKEAQNATFDCLYETLQSGMLLQGKLSVNEQADESSNRTSTLLVGLCCIAHHSPASLKKVVFALIQAIKVYGIETDTVQKVIGQVWKHWCYEDSFTFMEAHLGFLVDMWLQLEYSLVEFPYQLLKCDTLNQFYRNHHRVLVPFLALADKMAVVKSMAENLEEDWTEMVKASISCTMAFILPLIIDRGGDQEGTKKEAASLCLAMLNETYSKKVLETLIQSNLASIVVELWTRLYEPYSEDSKLREYLRPTDPEPNSPHFPAANILATLEYLTQCHSHSGSLTLVLLLSKSQDGLQQILHDLHSHVDRSHTMDDKHRGLLAYHLFVRLVLADIDNGLGNAWMFVLRTVINMLLQTIRGLQSKEIVSEERPTRDRCLKLAVDTLRAVWESCLELCHKELAKYLQVIIEVLVSLLTSAAREESLNLINLLVVRSSGLLADSLKDIDPLPDLPQLQTAKDTLTRMKDGDSNLLDEMSMFLMKEKIHSAGGLGNLKKLLSEKKDELAVLIGQCKDEGSEALVPQVICMLIKLCTESQDKKIQRQAAACLGEIGACNMSLIALQSVSLRDSMCYSTAATVYSQDSKGCRNAILIHLLNQNLVQQDVDTIQAAATCLKQVFSTQSGRQFYEDYKSKNIDDLLHYLHPFKPNKKRMSNISENVRSEEEVLSQLDKSSLWQPAVGIRHDSWVKQLTVGLVQSGAVQDDMLRLMEPVCAVRAAFAESVLPYFIHDILLSGDEARSAVLSSQIGGLLSRVCGTSETKTSRAQSPLLRKDAADLDPKVGQKCVQTLLTVVHYLRTQEKPTSGRHQKSNPWNNNFWLDMNYLLLAKAAQLCKAHFTCLLYTEIWYNVTRSQHEHLPDSGDSQGGSQHSLDTLSSNSEINVQRLLLEAYTSIGEPDGLYGCGVSRMTDHLARIHTYEHEGDWTSAVAGYDLLNSDLREQGSKAGLLQALQNAGLNHILQTYLKGVEMDANRERDPGLVEAQYEAAWRNGIWDLPEQASRDFSGFHNCLYGALSAIRDKDQKTCEDALERGHCIVAESLHHASLESIHSVYPLLDQLQALKEMHEVQSLAFGHEPLDAVLSRWNDHQRSIETSFDITEMTFKLRLSGLRLLADQSPETEKPAMDHGLTKHLIMYAKAATNAKRFQIAEESLKVMKSFESSLGSDSPGNLQWNRWLLEAEMFWAKSETSTALHLIRALIDKLSKLSARHETYKLLYPEALTLYGKWLAESRTESPHIIIANYLEKAVDICEAASSSRSIAMTAYLTLARFADAQYQHIVNYMKSPEFESKKGILNKYRSNVEQLTVMGDLKTRYYRNLQKQGDLDESEMESLLQDRSRYLNSSAECYLKYLKASSAELDIPVFRLCSLWFNNPTEESVNSLLQNYIKELPSSKFLPMLYQLAARMTTKTQDKENFHSILQQLIEKTAHDHPYHTLPIILALANANKDVVIAYNKKAGRLSRNAPQVSDASHADQDRMQAAALMVDRLRSGKTDRIIRDMEKLSDAYIELADWDVTQFKKVTKPINFPPNLQICTLKNLQTAVATVDIPVDLNCRYGNIVTIKKFELTFKLAGGINLPKIIKCIGSDGVTRRQLVKGKDDLRQDAVMQQVFGLVNHLLAQNPETRQRQLHIRRYKVVPLSQRSGILEWCEGTVPLGLYLLGNQKTDFGAHKRYRPDDKTSLQCRKLMQDSHTGDGNSRYRTFLKVCSGHFKPVFRHFFFEKFLEPAVWFEKRLAYSRSAATCSIVGYVVGLGDRHVQNILIDCNSAELVHIDLGVAFEQGRILPTPETIPFRLTRDLVDGMGVAGVEGVFRRCCEKTMEVMRHNQEALLAVLEVLLYDPLYDWTMSPMKALALQKQQDKLEADGLGDTNTSATVGNMSSINIDQMEHHGRSRYQAEQNKEEVNTVAERALLRLRQKLQGLEEGVALSVSGQINHLIQEARDPKNLCRVFPGWQPWV